MISYIIDGFRRELVVLPIADLVDDVAPQWLTDSRHWPPLPILLVEVRVGVVVENGSGHCTVIASLTGH